MELFEAMQCFSILGGSFRTSSQEHTVWFSCKYHPISASCIFVCQTQSLCRNTERKLNLVSVIYFNKICTWHRLADTSKKEIMVKKEPWEIQKGKMDTSIV